MRRRTTALAIAALIVGSMALPSVAAHASTTTLAQLESQLKVASPNLVGYDRTLFAGWTYTTGDGCDTRANVLKAQTQVAVTFSSGCTVATGQWYSWYDGQTWTDASQVQIDHLVPLGEAWASGAASWTSAQLSAYANDTVGYALQAVTSSVNESKGDQDPAVWIPPLASASCRYITDWVLEKYRWSLNVDTSEQAAIVSYMNQDGCGGETVTIPTVQVTGGGTPPVTDPPAGVTVYRFFNSQSGAHFFTASLEERNLIISTYQVAQWKYEDAAYIAYPTQIAGTVPLYRFWSNDYQGHFFTTSLDERNYVMSHYDTNTWNYEGIAFYVFPINYTGPGTNPVARFWSNDYHQHFYTASADEATYIKNTYPTHEWAYELDDWRVPSAAPTLAPMFDAKNCSDFLTQQQAQAWYNAYVAEYGDISRLDANNDGIACEAPKPPAPVNVVYPGAFCSVAGSSGVTSAGTPMVCTTTSTDSRLRWRAA